MSFKIVNANSDETMKVTKNANGKSVVKISRKDWEEMGKQAGWFDMFKKKRQYDPATMESTNEEEQNQQNQYDDQQRTKNQSFETFEQSKKGAIEEAKQAVAKQEKYIIDQRGKLSSSEEMTKNSLLEKINNISTNPDIQSAAEQLKLFMYSIKPFIGTNTWMVADLNKLIIQAIEASKMTIGASSRKR